MAMKTKAEVAKNVDEYIAAFEPAIQKKLEQLRLTIKKAAPDAEELISYQMPAYKYHGVLVYFAGYKNHIGFYATPTGHDAFKKELAVYKKGKGSVQFLHEHPLPLALINRIVKFRLMQNLAKVKISNPPKSLKPLTMKQIDSIKHKVRKQAKVFISKGSK
jgi:uncharacterized protein YdhG (YjbR/CyaY superfamily)